jgi:nicotinate-nucleotide adenylyltransferase
MRIGVLGGTFDPIHNGHLHLVEEARKKLGLDRVLFVPAYLAPHKESFKDLITPAPLRLAMVKLALSGRPHCRIVEWELRKKRKVYTFETLRYLKRTYPRNTEFFLLIGADNLDILNQWKNLPELLCLSRFVALTRPGFKKGRLPRGIVWQPIRPVCVSASEIRKRVRRRLSVRHLLPAKVAEFIKRQRLYLNRTSS